MFRTNNFSSSGGYICTRSMQYFTMHLWSVWPLTLKCTKMHPSENVNPTST